MTNYVDATGLHTESLTDIVSGLETAFKTIYGQDINLDANSPDAQMINIFAQAKADMLDCIAAVYNSFSPTSAQGVVLDQRAAINGVFRNGATNTIVEIDITTDRVVSLIGVSSNAGTPFTVSDGRGNLFYLIDGQTTISGVNTYQFISAVAGVMEITLNTLTTIETITLGVISVTNSTDPITKGTDEETDAAFRLRRIASVSLPSQGYLEGLTGALLDLNNVTGAKVYENNGTATDVYGIPSHSIWCVVDGGDQDEISDVIYKKRNAGCGMKGSVIVPITLVNGFTMPIKFDRPTYEELYIKLTITSRLPTHLIDENAIKDLIYNSITYNIYDPTDYTAITTVVKNFDEYAVVLSGGVSVDDITYSSYLYPSTIASRFVLSTSRIFITVV